MYLAEIEKAKDSPTSSFHGNDGMLNLTYTLFDLFVAGTETSSTTLSWTFLLFAMFPEVQEKFYQEIKTVIGTSRLPSLNDRDKMPYVQATIMEVMRYRPLAPLWSIHTTLEDVNFRGYKIPKQTLIISNLYACFTSKKIWGDPDVFRPERFLSDDKRSVLRHEAFFPFSIGRRVCLGESLARDELFLISTTVCQKLRMGEVPGGTKLKADHIPGVILAPKPHLLMIYDRGN